MTCGSLRHDTCSNQAVNGGDACTLGVTFAPTASGDVAATLTLPSNDAGSPAAVALTGMGTNKPQAPTLAVPTLPAHGLVLQAGSPGSRASVNVQMSAPGTVTSTVEQYTHGQWVKKGTQMMNASQAGPIRLTLAASVSGRALPAGRYRVLLQVSTKQGVSRAPTRTAGPRPSRHRRRGAEQCYSPGQSSSVAIAERAATVAPGALLKATGRQADRPSLGLLW